MINLHALTDLTISAVDMSAWVAPSTFGFGYGFHSSTELQIGGTDSTHEWGWGMRVHGTDFTYIVDAFGNVQQWTGGTITSIDTNGAHISGLNLSLHQFWSLLTYADGDAYKAALFRGDNFMTGASGDDVLQGYAGADVLNGAKGQDTLVGGDGNDTLLGRSGNDILKGDAGNDTLKGGSGDDLVDCSGATTSVHVGLSVIAAQRIGGSLGYDTLASVEGIIGSSFDDVLYGSRASNHLDGGAGNDTLHLEKPGVEMVDGGDGDDIIYFGKSLNGHDGVAGGDGIDVLDIDGDYTQGIKLAFDNVTGVETLRLEAGHDYKLNVFINFETIDASALGPNDHLVLKTGVPSLVFAGAGDDVIATANEHSTYTFHMEKGGSDTVRGQVEQDTFFFGDSYDTTDKINGGGGGDTLDLNGDYSSTTNVKATGLNLIKVHSGHDYNIRLSGGFFGDVTIDAAELTSADALIFDGAGKKLSGQIGVHVVGGAGDDNVVGSGIDDVFDMQVGGDDTVTGGLGTNIYRFGTAFTSADHIIGGEGVDILIVDETDGDFSLSSGSAQGIDTLTLQGDHDYVVHIDGDTLDAQAYRIAFDRGADDRNIFHFTFDGTNLSQDGTIHTTDVCDIAMGGGDDRVATGSRADTIHGGAGDDSIGADTGHNLVYGGAGDDQIGGDGRLYGGSGNDVLQISRTPHDLLNGGAGDDVLIGNYETRMTGGAGADAFWCGLPVSAADGSYDTITDFDPTHDTLYGDAYQHPNSITAIDPDVTTGELNNGATFLDDLQTAIAADVLKGHHAVAFQPDSGTLAGSTFLIVDVDGVAGFTGPDFIVRLTGTSSIAGLSVDNFENFIR
jgi:Ca2+-binding RTX toxin-like protein